MKRAIALLVGAALLAGCSASAPASAPQGSADAGGQTTPAPEGTRVIAYAAYSLEDAGTWAFQQGMVERATPLNYTVSTVNANNNVQKQADQIDFLISQKVAAIIAAPVDSAAICSSAKKAAAAGIPFFTIDRAPVGCTIDMTVYADNVLAGQQAGEAMVELLKARYGSAKGTVLELQGDLSTDVAVLRGKGFDDVIAQYPDIKLIQKPTKWRAELHASATRDVVSTEHVDGIYMHSDSVGIPVVLPTLEQIGKLKAVGDPEHIFITSVDASPVSLRAIRDGWADEASSQPLDDFGYVVNYVDAVLNGQAIPLGPVIEPEAIWSPSEIIESDTGPVLYLKTTPVTKANVDDPALWGNQY